MERTIKYEINPFQYKEVFATFDHYGVINNRLYVFTDDPSKLEEFDVLKMKYQINPFQYKEVIETFDHWSVEGPRYDEKLYAFTDDPSKLKEFDVLSCEEYNENQ